jgi:hypothetical protein
LPRLPLRRALFAGAHLKSPTFPRFPLGLALIATVDTEGDTPCRGCRWVWSTWRRWPLRRALLAAVAAEAGPPCRGCCWCGPSLPGLPLRPLLAAVAAGVGPPCRCPGAAATDTSQQEEEEDCLIHVGFPTYSRSIEDFELLMSIVCISCCLNPWTGKVAVLFYSNNRWMSVI